MKTFAWKKSDQKVKFMAKSKQHLEKKKTKIEKTEKFYFKSLFLNLY